MCFYFRTQNYERGVTVFLLSIAVILLGILLFMYLLSADILILFNLPALVFLLIPLLGVLIATNSLKVFAAGIKVVVFPKEEIAEDIRGKAASLFRLLSKTTILAAVVVILISFITIFMNLNLEEHWITDTLIAKISMPFITLIYAIVLILAVFEPIVFILKKRSGAGKR